MIGVLFLCLVTTSFTNLFAEAGLGGGDFLTTGGGTYVLWKSVPVEIGYGLAFLFSAAEVKPEKNVLIAGSPTRSMVSLPVSAKYATPVN